MSERFFKVYRNGKKLDGALFFIGSDGELYKNSDPKGADMSGSTKIYPVGDDKYVIVVNAEEFKNFKGEEWIRRLSNGD